MICFALARSVTRPLQTLERATAQLFGGRITDPPAADQGPPELRRLAASFTRTATRFQHLLQARQAFASEASPQLKTPLTALRLRLENFRTAPRPLRPRRPGPGTRGAGAAQSYGAGAVRARPAGELRDQAGDSRCTPPPHGPGCTPTPHGPGPRVHSGSSRTRVHADFSRTRAATAPARPLGGGPGRNPAGARARPGDWPAHGPGRGAGRPVRGSQSVSAGCRASTRPDS
ncbi:HAMP domain-containing protein [Streptomyces sp. NPDC018347]|uniref:HAMP domain-containing protein n=1 Tax=Streptomyces sp. NPDC018347 TaxID=3157193 RepID=UPI0033EB2571